MRRLGLLLALAPAPAAAQACAGPVAVCASGATTAVRLIAGGHPARVVSDPGDDAGVTIAARNLAGDLRALGGGDEGDGRTAVIVGTLGHSTTIDRLARAGRIDAGAIRGKWEGFLQQVVDRPAPGIDRALVIAGADRRGTIFGIYDLSRRAGVSPWTWWADVPVPHRPDLVALPGQRSDAPKVKYRGIFLNDEEPALGPWARAKFGGINHQFYERVFDLVLRLKGDMIWPAMWGKSLWEDDPESAKLAERMGVILGTSHHEPAMRAQVEWDRHGTGPWDYTKNAAELRTWWRDGIERTQGQDRLVTIGMRGNGDEPMTEGTAIPLLERIVSDQRTIIADVTGKPAKDTPQVWALYKEVQDYYDKGMRVPDDVTLLFSDDNWGNIRRLPEKPDDRAGGYGVYYHFDYVGGPRNYKWINTNQISRTWEQMSLAYARGARRLWIVNVGDLKPMEMPTSFFLDYAWDPDAWPRTRLADYHRRWAAEQFGAAAAPAIADILDRTQRYVALRKPELLSPDVWNAQGWSRVLGRYDRLQADAEAVGKALPAERQDAYFELVLHPVLASANLNRLYATVSANRACAAAGDPAANALATRAAALFANDKTIAARYEAAANGKWPHMMDQIHIGYSSWKEPEADLMPAVERVAGSGRAHDTGCTLAATPAPPGPPDRAAGGAFVETDGVVAVDATDFAATHPADGAAWLSVPQLGRTGSAVSIFPQVGPAAAAGRGAALDYHVVLAQAGPIVAQVVAAPSLDPSGHDRLRYALSVDGGPAQVVNLLADPSDTAWNQSVIADARVGATRFDLSAGPHTVRLWAVDRGVVAERLVLSREALDPLALDLPESPRR